MAEAMERGGGKERMQSGPEAADFGKERKSPTVLGRVLKCVGKGVAGTGALMAMGTNSPDGCESTSNKGNETASQTRELTPLTPEEVAAQMPAPQPVGWTQQWDGYPSISKGSIEDENGEPQNVIVFTSAADGISFVLCGESGECLTNGSPQKIEGLLTTNIYQAAIYKDVDGQAWIVYSTPGGGKRMKIEYQGGVFTAYGSEEFFLLANYNFSLYTESGTPYIIIKGSQHHLRRKINLHTLDEEIFEAGGYPEVEICGLPSKGFNMAIGTKYRKLIDNTEVCEVHVAPTLAEIKTNSTIIATFNRYAQHKDPQMIMLGDYLIVLTWTYDNGLEYSVVDLSPEEPPETPTIANIDKNNEVQPISVPHGTSEADAKLQLAQTIVVEDSEGGEHTVNIDWTIESYNPNTAGDYNATGTWEIPTDPNTGDPLMEGTPTPVETIVTVEEEVIEPPTIEEIDIHNQVQPISVAYGTSETDAIAQLAQTIVIRDSDGGEHSVNVSWAITGYNPNIAGNYNAVGTLTNIPAEIDYDPSNPPTVDTTVNVRPEESPDNPTIEEIDVTNQVQPISVEYGTSEADAKAQLAQTIVIRDSDGGEHSVNLSWTISGYNSNLAGNYDAVGTLTNIPAEIEYDPANPPTVETTVTVEEEVVEPLPTIEEIDIHNQVQPISVEYGTPLVDARGLLVQKITVKDSEYNEYEIDINWTIPGYNPNVANTYTAVGTLTNYPETVEVPDPPLEVTTTVTVEEEVVEPDACDFARAKITFLEDECGMEACEDPTLRLRGMCKFEVDVGGENPVVIELDGVYTLDLLDNVGYLLAGKHKVISGNNSFPSGYGSYGLAPVGTTYGGEGPNIEDGSEPEYYKVWCSEGRIHVYYNDELIAEIEGTPEGEENPVLFIDGEPQYENGENGNGNGENGNGNGENGNGENGDENGEDEDKKNGCGGCDTGANAPASSAPLVLLGGVLLALRGTRPRTNKEESA